MSAICQRFVPNAWRKDICSNCFQDVHEHSALKDLNRYNSTHHNHSQYQHQEVGNGVSGGKNSSGSAPITSNNQNNNSGSNHSISILVKNTDNNKMSTGRYQSPNQATGIPRVNSYKYQQNHYNANHSNNSLSSTNSNSSSSSTSSSPLTLNKSSIYNNNNSNNHSSYNQSSDMNKFNKRSNVSSTANDTSSSSSEVIRVGGNTSNSSTVSSKKVMTHPLKGGDNNPRVINNILNGTSPLSPSSTVVNVNGSSSASNKHTSSTTSSNNIPSYYSNNNRHVSSNAHQHNASQPVTNESNATRKDSSSNGVGSGTSSSVLATNSSQNNNYNSQKQWNGANGRLTSNIVPMEEKNVKSSATNFSNNIKLAKMESTVTNNIGSNGNSVVQKSSYNVDSPDGEINRRRYKGILKAEGKHRRKMSVKFPKEVCKVIHCNGKYSEVFEDSDSEEEEIPDPQDLVSIAELLATNSVTTDEKEMLRLTVKNTNFNSIKTNLMGYAPIEIGPIVGCTGGKSMENSSKPLVSIGTFDARKEPLRIIRKCGGDDDDDDVDSKEFNRKEMTVGKVAKLPNNHNSNTNTSSNSNNSAGSNVVKYNNNSSTTANATKSEVPKSLSQKVNTTTTTASSSSSATTTNVNSSRNIATPTTDNTVVNVNVNSTLTSAMSQPPNSKQNPNQTSTTSNSSQSSGGGNDVKINGKDVVTGNLTHSNNSYNNNGVSTIEVNPEKSSIKITTGATTTSTSSPVEGVEKRNLTTNSGSQVQVKPKPILKNNQHSTSNSNNNSEISSSATTPTTSLPTTTTTSNSNNSNKNSKDCDNFSDTSSSSSSPSTPVSNLIILNGGNIASKRTSFLKEIISPEQPEVTVMTMNSQQVTTIGSFHNIPNQDVTSNSTPSLNLETDSLEVVVQNNKNSIMPPPKADIKLDAKLQSSPFDYNLIQDHGSEFDDSLEDSGLDIGSHDGKSSGKSIENVENSESDNDAEKFGSSSDSGNENDYNDRIVVPKGGLYISVDDDVDGKNEENCSKPKLSPDSVLFSSASEMSASGSSESIPECVNVHVVNNSKNSNNANQSPTNNNVKRPAPLPPSPTTKPTTMTKATGGYDNEDIYDDVASYQNDRRRREQSPEADYDDDDDNDNEEAEDEDEPEEESIYDDCTAASSSSYNNGSSNGKNVGSYDFTNGTRTMLDTDGHDSAEKIPLRPSDGIEFIGIRKIDSETHLNATIQANTPRSPSPENSKRSSSVSPKARRKVNQFFSTIGKKAGAAFSSHSPLNGGTVGFIRNKSPSPAPLSSAYKRSLSQDEVSMTRTQELYATITPTSLKFKGLAPVLQKLSRMDMMDPSGGSGSSSKDSDSPKEKMFKKNKIIPSIKKLWNRMGSNGKEGEISSGSGERTSYDFKTDLNMKNSISSPLNDSSFSPSSSPSVVVGNSSSSESSSLESASNRSSYNLDSNTPSATSPTLASVATTPIQTAPYKPPIAARPIPPIGRPPPPPPRVHSLDLLNKNITASGPNGTVKPARPPPPTVRSNRIAPSFVSVFAAAPSPSDDNGDVPRDPGPPNKPKRKASMNGHNHLMRNNNNPLPVISNNDGEMSLESNVTSLNFETLRLIASQAPKKIKRKSPSHLVKFSGSPIRWSNFHISDMDPICRGDRFAFYPALWDRVEPCVLLLQDSHSDDSALQLSCVEVSTTFVDSVPICLAPWKSMDYADEASEVKLSISVLPSCTVQTIEKYTTARSTSPMQKYFALLLALDYWGQEEMSDLIVFQAGSSKDEEPTTPADSELVYVIPTSNRMKQSKRSSASYSQLSSNFEISMKQLLLQPQVLNEYDRQVLFRVISGGSQKEVEAQLKLFLQAKLFGHRIKAEDMERLRRNKSERILFQYLEKERALCMKEAISQTLQRNSEPNISPLKTRFVEFLMIPDASAKLVLELILDLFR